MEPVQLQVVCYRLWQNLAPDDNLISEEDVAHIGDVNQSLRGYYAERVAAIGEETGIPERKLREWFERKLITETGIRSQVLMGQGQSEGLDNAAIRLLENAHLVRAEKRRGVTWFELAHDRLIQPVRQDNAEWFQANLSLLQRQAEVWLQRRPARRHAPARPGLIGSRGLGGSSRQRADRRRPGFPGREPQSPSPGRARAPGTGAKVGAGAKTSRCRAHRAEEQSRSARRLRRILRL